MSVVRSIGFRGLAALGRSLVARDGYDLAACQAWSNLKDLPLGRRLMVYAYREAALAEYYAESTSSARREALKALFMGEDSGARWAERYAEHNPYHHPDSLAAHLASKAALRWLIDDLASGSVSSVHLIGCSSGRDCAYLAERFPAAAVRGSDFDRAIVAFCEERYHLPNLGFRVVDASEADAIGVIEEDALLSTGVVSYLDRDALHALLAHLPSRRVYIAEPRTGGFRGVASRSAGNFQWDHPYREILLAAGWRVEREEVVRAGRMDQVSLLASR